MTRRFPLARGDETQPQSSTGWQLGLSQRISPARTHDISGSMRHELVLLWPWIAMYCVLFEKARNWKLVTVPIDESSSNWVQFSSIVKETRRFIPYIS